MAKEKQLKLYKCPTCGDPLKVDGTESIVLCPSCGNPYSLVDLMEPSSSTASASAGTVKVDGIKTPSSALAYLENFYEDYDWEAFSYAQVLTISETDALAESIKVTSADDPKTWFLCFNAVYVPYMKKIEGCRKILVSIIEEYSKNNMDAYSKFDAYKRISSLLISSKEKVIGKLEGYLAKAEKYEVDEQLSQQMQQSLDDIKQNGVLMFYAKLEDIPRICRLMEERNAAIAEQLAARGINAEQSYAQAKKLIQSGQRVPALQILTKLQGFADSKELIRKLDRYFLISEAVEIGSKFYHFKKQTDGTGFDLYPTKNSMIAAQPIIKHIGQILTNFGDILYYLDTADKLIKYDLSTGIETTLSDDKFNSKQFYVYKSKLYLLTKDSSWDSIEPQNVMVLSLAEGTLKTILTDVGKVLSLNGCYLSYTVRQKMENNKLCVFTNILNVNTLSITRLGKNSPDICGYSNNYVIFTTKNPSERNMDLYTKPMNQAEPPRLIEKNIYEFKDVIKGKIFYYVGNKGNKSLISIDIDGSNRHEMPRLISRILYEQGGWLYFIRRAGYNSALCKSRMDGTEFKGIAYDIDESIAIKNGYLYYKDSYNALIKVRMDGSNQQRLCDDVEEVLSVKEDKIVFVSTDDIYTQHIDENTSTKRKIRSIYAVEFDGSGKRKLAYNIKEAQKYDDDTVYFIAARSVKKDEDDEAEIMDVLYKLDVPTYTIEQKIFLKPEETPDKTSAFTIAMVIMVICFVLGCLGLSYSLGMGIIGIIGGFLSLFVGLVIKINSKDNT